MDLAEEIIAILGSEKCDLVDALVKTRILASKLGNAQLAEWCRNELSGYPEGSEVPPYRHIQLILQGTVANGAYRHRNQPLPTAHLTKEQREIFTRSVVREGITAVQSWTDKDVAVHFSVDLAYLFRDVIQATYVVENLQGVPSVGAHAQILVEVRARLLEFALEVQPTLPSDESLRGQITTEMKEKINTMFQGAVFGDHTLIQIGDDNVAKVKHGASTGDLASLLAQLRTSGLTEDDAQALSMAIAADGAAATESKQLGQHVRSWMAAVLGKAATGAWEIGVATAGTLVASALSNFYGFRVG
ncbi:hypothetical protein JAK72_11265 [Stenotrophomonas maltophilia]|uniref:AbiTii domain-containing protein n=1 Tax=Stenotrophomonas maltophilia TaxID=40324 RepID=UPI0021C86B00|nr:hypothetical protein [Stenotrophomonas maltophilia]MCU1038760.1 hypothetical protein [Stenotrophomonas maltophilia]